MVSETTELSMLLLTISAISFATGSRNKISFGDRALSTHLEGLADLERDDPKFAFPAARLVGRY